MCSRPAMPNICAAGGAASGSRSSNELDEVAHRRLLAVVEVAPSDPFCIRSKPSASTQSARPPLTSWRAMNSAVDPVEQLLLTFVTGMPVSPSS